MPPMTPERLRIGDTFTLNGSDCEYSLVCIYMDLGIALTSRFGKTEYTCLCMKPTDREIKLSDGTYIPSGSFVCGKLSSGKLSLSEGSGKILSELEEIFDNQPVNHPYEHLSDVCLARIAKN